MTHLRPTWLPLVSSEWIPWRLLRRLRSNNLLRERHRLSLQLLFQDLLLRPPVLEPQDPVEPTPMPVGDSPWTTAHPQTSPMADSQLHQRVVHTQLFKLIELDDGPHRKTELWISEADWMGRESRLCERQARLLHLRMEGSLKDCQLLAPSFCGPRSAL